MAHGKLSLQHITNLNAQVLGEGNKSLDRFFFATVVVEGVEGGAGTFESS